MAKKNNEQNRWSSGLKGYCKLFQNEYTYKNDKGKKFTGIRFSTSIGRKDKDSNEWDNMFLTVKFKKELFDDVAPEEVVAADIKDAFLTFDSYKDKNKNEQQRLVLMVTDCKFYTEDDELPF